MIIESKIALAVGAFLLLKFGGAGVSGSTSKTEKFIQSENGESKGRYAGGATISNRIASGYSERSARNTEFGGGALQTITPIDSGNDRGPVASSVSSSSSASSASSPSSASRSGNFISDVLSGLGTVARGFINSTPLGLVAGVVFDAGKKAYDAGVAENVAFDKTVAGLPLMDAALAQLYQAPPVTLEAKSALSFDGFETPTFGTVTPSADGALTGTTLGTPNVSSTFDDLMSSPSMQQSDPFGVVGSDPFGGDDPFGGYDAPDDGASE